MGSIILTYLALINRGAEYLQTLIADNAMTMQLVRSLDDPSVPWLGLIVGIPILGFYFWGNNQTLVQRVLSARSVDEGRKGVLLVVFLTVLTLFFIIYPGVMAKDLFPGLEKPDMVYPKLVLELMPVGLLGVMMAALVAALTSTLSAILNSVSTLFTMDFYSVLKEGEVSSDEQVRVGRITSVVVLVIAVFWAPQIGGFDSLVKYYQQMLSYIAPPIVAAFFHGLFSKRANATGTISGLITGLVVAVLLLFYKESIFGDMHFLLVVPYLFGFSLLVMIGVSWLTNEPPKEKIEEYTWSKEIFIKETKQMKGMKWYRNYRFWSLALLVFCFVVLWLYR